jgi:hypothetical protein
MTKTLYRKASSGQFHRSGKAVPRTAAATTAKTSTQASFDVVLDQAKRAASRQRERTSTISDPGLRATAAQS